MIIQLEQNISLSDKDKILNRINEMDFQIKEVKTQCNRYIIAIVNGDIDIRAIGNLKGVKDIHRVTDEYKLVSKKWKVQDTVIDLGNNIRIHREDFTIIAGPCSVEGEEQIQHTVQHLKKNQINIMRGGVFKPRSSPYSFRGVGIEGLKILSGICREHGIKVITEVMEVAQIEKMIEYVDVFQIGARNSQNFNLLDALGSVDKPVLIKRGMSGTIEELLHSAEYIFSSGNEKIILCERGIRTHEKAYRNTLDLNAVPILKEKTHLPVIVDPSHGVGIRKYIEPMALAAVMSGADGIMIEIHEVPEKSFSDGEQTLNFYEAEKLYGNLRKTYELRKNLRNELL